MKSLFIITCLLCFSSSLFCQHKTGFVFSSSVSSGDVIKSEYRPRVTGTIRSHKFILDYHFVKWDHTVLRFGTGYQFVKCRETNLDYILFPVTFQRFIKEEKLGFNYSLILYPSLNVGDRTDFCGDNTSKFHIQLAIRAGSTFIDGKHKLSIELELASIMDTIRKNSSVKFVTYGVRIGYYLN